MTTATAAAAPTATRTLVRTPRSPHQDARRAAVRSGAGPEEVLRDMTICFLREPGTGGRNAGTAVRRVAALGKRAASDSCGTDRSVVIPLTEMLHLCVPSSN